MPSSERIPRDFVRIIGVDRRIAVETAGDLKLKMLVKESLTYSRSRMLRGEEAKQAKEQGLPIKVTERVECCIDNEAGQVEFPAGFIPRVVTDLREHGYNVHVDRSRSPAVRPNAFQPSFDNLKAVLARWEKVKKVKFKWRKSLLKAIKSIVKNESGQYEIPTGAGKTIILVIIAALFPRAKIHIATKSSTLLADLETLFCRIFPSVGVVKSSRRETSRRIVLFSLSSIHHSDYDADFLLVDEAHESGTDKIFESLLPYQTCRSFGLSASLTLRRDGGDMLIEGLLGPVRVRIPYQEVVEEGDIRDIRVIWRSVPGKLPSRSCWAIEQRPSNKQKIAVWRYKPRNERIAEDLRYFLSLGLQVLVSVQFVEHALWIRKDGGFSPEELPIVFDKVDMKKAANFRRLKLIQHSGELMMTPARRGHLKKAFESGKLRAAIATSVWSRGVNFMHLDVLQRAEAVMSGIPSVQLPGRLSRLNPRFPFGILVDYRNSHFEEFIGIDAARKKIYEAQGWQQFEVPGSLAKEIR